MSRVHSPPFRCAAVPGVCAVLSAAGQRDADGAASVVGKGGGVMPQCVSCWCKSLKGDCAGYSGCRHTGTC